MSIHYRSGRPNYGCTSSLAIKGGHERDSSGVCGLCGDGPHRQPVEAAIADLSNCPFCDGVMAPFGPDQFNHPSNGCWLSSVGVVRKEFAAWNRRAAPSSPVADDGLPEPVAAFAPNGRSVKWDANYAKEPWASAGYTRLYTAVQVRQVQRDAYEAGIKAAKENR